jgi:hypothetical protein
MRLSRLRGLLLASAILYQFALQWAYIQEISPRWAYAGFTYDQPPAGLWLLATAMAVLPALWMPLGLSRPSALLYLYLYLAAYAPAPFLLVARSTSDGAPFHYLPFLVALLLCFALLAGVYRLPLLRVSRPDLPRPLFWVGIVVFVIVGNVVIFLTFAGSLRIVGSGDVLSQRLGARETFSENALAGYLFTLLAYAINPMIIAIGLWQRRWWLIATGGAGQLFLFSVNAARGLIAAMALTLVVYFALQVAQRSATLVIVGALSTCIVVCVVGANLSSGSIRQEFDWAVYRTLMIPASTVADYYDYFNSNPRTDFAHVRGLGMLADDPYDGKPIGIVVGTSRGSPDHNENGNLWADGYAAAGFAGMLIVTFLASLVLFVLDSVASGVPTTVAALALVPHAANLADIPLFTVFLGSGLGLTIVLMYLLPFRRGRVGGPVGVRAV